MHHIAEPRRALPRHSRAHPSRRSVRRNASTRLDTRDNTSSARVTSGGANARMRGGALALRAPCARVAWRRRDVRRATRRVSSANGDVWPAVSVRRMRPDDLPAVIEILVDASDPAKVSAAALASYAREGCGGVPPRGAGTRRGDRRGSARTSRGGRGGGGPAPGGSAQTSGDATGRREHRLRAQPRRRREGATKRRRQGAPPRRRACRRARRIRRGGLPRGRRQLRRARDVRPRRLSTRRAQETRRVPQNSWRPSTASPASPTPSTSSWVPAHSPLWSAPPRGAPWTPRRDSPSLRRGALSDPPPDLADMFGTAGGCCRRSRRVRSIRGGARGGVRGSIRRRWRGRRHVRHRRPSGGFHMLSRPRYRARKEAESISENRSRASTTTTTPPPRKSDSSFCSWASANVRRPTVRPFCLRLPCSRERRGVSRHGRDGSRAAATGRDDGRARVESAGWRTLGVGASADDPRMEDGWVALEPEPEPSFEVAEDYERDDSGRMVYALADFFTTACGRATAANGSRWTSASSARVAAELSRCARDYPARTARSAQTWWR